MSNTHTRALPQRALLTVLVALAMAALALVGAGAKPAHAATCVYSLGVSSLAIPEGSASNLPVTRTGDCPAVNETVLILPSESGVGVGFADQPLDFNFVSTGATFSAGETSSVALIPTLQDVETEVSETFTVTLQDPTGDSTIGGVISATITILDDDGAATYSYSAATYAVTEGTPTVTVTVLRSGGTANTGSVQCTVTGGTATQGAGADFTVNDDIANFAPLATTSSCVFNINDDGTQEVLETIILGMAGGVNGSPGGQTTTTINITDNDGSGVLQFSQATYNVSEGAGVAQVAVTRTGGSTGSVSVQCNTTGGSATNGTDYTAFTGQLLTFGNGVTQQFCNITILATDTSAEPQETVGLSLTNVSGATIGAQSTATLLIDDDDGTGNIVFSSSTYTGPENGGAITITVNRLSGTGSGSVTYTASTGTAPAAISGTDFFAASGTLTWGVSDLAAKTFTVTPIDDALVEGNENISLTLSAPTGGLSLGNPSTATLVLTDNESPLPVISLLSPASGPTVGGTAVTITGINFTGATLVTFDGLPCTSLVVVSSNTITCVTPAHASGTVQVVITTPAGSNSTAGAANDFTYTGGPTVTLLTPNTGPATGNTIVTINGTNFTSSGTTVRFGGVLAVHTYINSTELVAVAPAHSAGTVDVTVQTPGGTSPNTANDDYTYTGASLPVIISLSPSSGNVGTGVVIAGSGFTGATSVTFGGVSASFTVNTDGQITATVPTGTPLGSVDVRVTTPSGTSPNTANDNFNNTSAASTVTYTLYFRFTLIVWTGPDNYPALNALQGLESPDNPLTNNIVNLVGVIWLFDPVTQTFDGFFPNAGNVPGANDFTMLRNGRAYFIALLNPGTVNWTSIGSN